VLDKMRDAIQLCGLVPRTDAKKETERRAAYSRHRVRQDRQAVSQPCNLYVFYH